MEFTVFLTQQPDNPWRAVVHELPDCVVEAPTRAEALEKIQQRITSIVRYTEVVRLPVTMMPKTTEETHLFTQIPWQWFGALEGNTFIEGFYDEIEHQRETHLLEN